MSRVTAPLKLGTGALHLEPPVAPRHASSPAMAARSPEAAPLRRAPAPHSGHVLPWHAEPRRAGDPQAPKIAELPPILADMGITAAQITEMAGELEVDPSVILEIVLTAAKHREALAELNR